MTQMPPEDRSLVDFLRQYRPAPPSPAPDLEERTMAIVGRDASLGRDAINRVSTKRFPWLVPSAIAASILVVWGGARLLVPSQPNTAELANLEAFLENNWDGVEADSQASDSQTETDWLFQDANNQESTNNN